MQEPIPFAEMYRRKMNKDVELARLKKLANKKQQQLPDSEKTKLMDTKPIKNIFAQKLDKYPYVASYPAFMSLLKKFNI